MTEKTIDILVVEREKQGVAMAKRIVDFIERFGQLQQDGDAEYNEGAVTFHHDRLFNTVVVSHAVPVFRVNLLTKTCPLYKTGSWEMILTNMIRRLEEGEANGSRYNEVRVRENMGVGKI